MARWQEKVSLETAKRNASLAKVEPKLQGVPDGMPTNCIHLPSIILSKRELEITENYSSVELLQALRTRKLSVEEVTRAFLRRAALAHAATNCLTELLWDPAIARARELDALPEPRGVLFGLPISTKEHLGMVGPDTTTNASFVSMIGQEHGSTIILDTLWAEGCVFFARTTLPQAAMALETNSNVYGRTVNPYNRGLTAGGSSGGEAALIAMHGSLLGVGSDIGGSIRVPAAHVGLYGFKPTSKRISAQGVRHYDRGEVSLYGAPGPLATDRTSLELFMNVAVSAQPWLQDSSIIPTTWIPYRFPQPLKIGIQWWDGVVQPHPPMLRALREVAAACSKAGMQLLDWECGALNHEDGWEILTSLYWPDGGEGLREVLEESGEPILPLTRFILHEQRHVKKLSLQERREREHQRTRYQETYAKAWDSQDIDIILCPPSFGCATPHDQSRYWGYGSIWNLLDYPAAVFPVTTVDPQVDLRAEDYKPRNQQDRFVHDMYHPEIYADAPVGLQVVGRRLCDEKVLAALEEIERAMGRS